MQVVAAIDLMAGRVVRGVGGRRKDYQPIRSRLTPTSNPGDVAVALRRQFGISIAYVADLDAIAGGPFDVDSYRQIAAAGWQLWVDAGVGDLRRGEQFLNAIESVAAVQGVVVGLESLTDRRVLADLLRLVGPQRAMFSLDMQAGRLLTRIAAWSETEPREVIQAVVDAGFRRLILLDLADVGAGRGTGTLELCRHVKRSFPQVEVTSGGGVRNRNDLQRLQDAGCDAALVASALHDGSLSPEEVQPV